MRTLVLLLSFALGASAQWTPIFNGKNLDGWRETQFTGHGKVTIEDGSIVLGHGAPMTGVTLAAEFPKVDYEIRWEAQRRTGNDFFSSLTFPVGEAYLTWVTGGWGGDIIGISSLDGWDASENETRSYFEFENGRWYKMRLQVRAGRLTAWIDDKAVINVSIAGRELSLRHGEIKLSAPLGFASYATVGVLRNIEYRRLEPAKP